MTKRLVGGVIGLGLGIAAALGISGRDGFGADPDTDVIRPPDRSARVDKTRSDARMPELGAATGWVNTAPLTAASLRGKVVVVEFWTFSCINWRRQLPYVRAWAQRYRDDGLVVIGVHTPEFGFEHDATRVEHAARTMNVPYPIAIDSDYGVWEAFHNMYWPALYFIDSEGRLRHSQFGEGEYAASEMVIRQLLAESGRKVEGPLVAVEATGLEAPADERDLLTPETYAGYARTREFRSPTGPIRDRSGSYQVPAALRVAQWALGGAWTMSAESVVSEERGARVVYRFHARDFHAVMGSHGGVPVRFRIRIDGTAPGNSRGGDVDSDGNGVISEPRLYQLVRQAGEVRDREIEIEFFDAGVELFSFTFG